MAVGEQKALNICLWGVTLLHSLLLASAFISSIDLSSRQKAHSLSTVHQLTMNKMDGLDSLTARQVPLETSKLSLKFNENQFSGRPLGSFEQYLSGTREECGCVALSHVSAAEVEFKWPEEVVEAKLTEALAAVAHLHPLLRARIQGKGEFWEPMPMMRIGEDLDPPSWCPIDITPMEIANSVLEKTTLDGNQNFDIYWKEFFQHSLDNAKFEEDGPQWKVNWLHQPDGNKNFFVFSFNHAISDQTSANMLLNQVLSNMDEESVTPAQIEPYPLPPCIEETVGARGMTVGTAKYALEQMVNGGKSPVLLPDSYTSAAPSKQAELSPESVFHPRNRKTFCEFRSLSGQDFKEFAKRCKAEGVTITAGLSAIQMIVSAAVAMGDNLDQISYDDTTSRTYKFLLAVDLRPFDENEPGKDWTGGTMASSGGAVDFTVSLQDSFVKEMIQGRFVTDREETDAKFWDLARHCREETLKFIATDKVRETAIMFDWGMNYVDIPEVMNLEAKNPKTLGRLFSSGLSNMGIYKYKTEHKNLKLRRIHYATSQTLTGCLHQLSCGTVDGNLLCTFQFTEPISSRDEGQWFATKSLDIILSLIKQQVSVEAESDASRTTVKMRNQ